MAFCTFFLHEAGRQLASSALVHDRLNWGVRERDGKQTTVYTSCCLYTPKPNKTNKIIDQVQPVQEVVFFKSVGNSWSLEKVYE